MLLSITSFFFRASLTISVKKPGKTVKFTTPKTARKNKVIFIIKKSIE